MERDDGIAERSTERLLRVRDRTDADDVLPGPGDIARRAIDSERADERSSNLRLLNKEIHCLLSDEPNYYSENTLLTRPKPN